MTVVEDSMSRQFKNIVKYAKRYLLKKEKHLILLNKEKLLMPQVKD
jgi:hypothetical protein